MRFLFDVNFSPKLANCISALESGLGDVEIVSGRDKFADDTPDPQWIRQLGVEGDWIVVTADQRISRSPDEKKAWDESKLTTYFFSEKFASSAFWAQAQELVCQWQGLRSHARTAAKASA